MKCAKCGQSLDEDTAEECFLLDCGQVFCGVECGHESFRARNPHDRFRVRRYTRKAKP